MQIAAHEAGRESEKAGCCQKQRREVAAGATAAADGVGGSLHAGLKREIGIPCFAWIDEGERKHLYRLARTKGGVKYWHYLGMLGVDKNIKPCLRPTPHGD